MRSSYRMTSAEFYPVGWSTRWGMLEASIELGESDKNPPKTSKNHGKPWNTIINHAFLGVALSGWHKSSGLPAHDGSASKQAKVAMATASYFGCLAMVWIGAEPNSQRDALAQNRHQCCDFSF